MISNTLLERSGAKCELCGSTTDLREHALAESQGYPDSSVVMCGVCESQVNTLGQEDDSHWRCLSSSMWSEVAAVQVLSWRMLNRLSGQTWAQDLLDMLYLDESLQKWAEAGATSLESQIEPTLDVNGVVLKAGDDVVIIKDLDVKGTSFVAKRGTAVRGISLSENPKHIEGRVNGTRVVLIADYVKKS